MASAWRHPESQYWTACFHTGEVSKEVLQNQIGAALAWVLAQKPWIVPIPGTTKLERLEENLRSVDLKFTPEEWRDLNHAVSKIKLQGDRYPTDQEKQVGH